MQVKQKKKRSCDIDIIMRGLVWKEVEIVGRRDVVIIGDKSARISSFEL